MPNKHFCQGPHCHTRPTSDRFLKSKGIIRGRYASVNIDHNFENSWYNNTRGKYFCSQTCESNWLNENMSAIEMGIPVPFIRERRFTEGYEKVKEDCGFGRSYSTIKAIDRTTET